MPDRQQLEALFLAHLGLIERLLGKIARGYRLRGAEAEDFASWAKLRLVEDDYRILSRVRDEAAVPGYLATVVARLANDYAVRRHGRWRPSAAALREGPLAVRFERLVERDGYSLEEAAEVLRASGEDVPSTRELLELRRRIPHREPRRRPDAEPAEAEAIAGNDAADAAVVQQEAAASQGLAERALACALGRLDDEDRVIVRMRFWEGSSVADIARALGLPQQPLYARLKRALAVVRDAVEAEGVGRAETREYLAADAREVPRAAAREPSAGDVASGRPDAARPVLPFPVRNADP